MSLEAQIWAVEQRAGDPVAKFVLLLLAGDADENGCSMLPRDTIARLTEMALVDVDRAVTRLRKRGFVKGGTRSDEALRLTWE